MSLRRGRRAKIKLRKGTTLEVLVNPGYIELVTRNREVMHCITLPRDKGVVLLRWLIPLVKQMPESVDPITVLSEWEAVDDSQSYARRQRRRSPRRSKKRRR